MDFCYSIWRGLLKKRPLKFRVNSHKFPRFDFSFFLIFVFFDFCFLWFLFSLIFVFFDFCFLWFLFYLIFLEYSNEWFFAILRGFFLLLILVLIDDLNYVLLQQEYEGQCCLSQVFYASSFKYTHLFKFTEFLTVLVCFPHHIRESGRIKGRVMNLVATAKKLWFAFVHTKIRFAIFWALSTKIRDSVSETISKLIFYGKRLKKAEQFFHGKVIFHKWFNGKFSWKTAEHL